MLICLPLEMSAPGLEKLVAIFVKNNAKKKNKIKNIVDIFEMYHL